MSEQVCVTCGEPANRGAGSDARCEIHFAEYAGKEYKLITLHEKVDRLALDVERLRKLLCRVATRVHDGAVVFK